MQSSRVKQLACLVLFLVASLFVLSDFESFGGYNPFTLSEAYSAASIEDVLASTSNTSSTLLMSAGGELDNGTELCPATPPGLVGPIRVWMDGPAIEQIEKLYGEDVVAKGGHGSPKECVARHKVALIVPYRARDLQLRILLHNMHSFLTKQQLDYGIYIVEQIANQTFNRAKLMNIGFAEAIKDYNWDCFIFHDVDLLPEDDRNIYSCPAQPRHMSVAIDKFKYELPYGSIFGGISAMTREQVEKINGFSNDYWGWGGEDDDLSTRVSVAGYQISRYPAKIARYKMVKHSHESSNEVNKCRYKIMAKTKRRWMNDGISSLNYKLVQMDKRPLYTNLLVDLLYAESHKALLKTFPGC